MNNNAVKRIKADLREMMANPSDKYHAEPLEDNLFDWHFTICGPEDSDYENGFYHGRILLPTQYPFKPPNIKFLTPNGRFDIKTKICLSVSAHHPEEWQPAWGIRLILEALRVFMASPGIGALGAIEIPSSQRKKLAIESHHWKCSLCGKLDEIMHNVKMKREQQILLHPNNTSVNENKFKDQISNMHFHGLKQTIENVSESNKENTLIDDTNNKANESKIKRNVKDRGHLNKVHNNTPTRLESNNNINNYNGKIKISVLFNMIICFLICYLVYKKYKITIQT